MKHVVISEKWDKKSAKYLTPAVPFPFASKDLYEKSIRQPMGRDVNPDKAFRDMTRPAVLKSTGVVIQPIQYSKPLAEHSKEMAGGMAKVAKVAGGKPLRSKAR